MSRTILVVRVVVLLIAGVIGASCGEGSTPTAQPPEITDTGAPTATAQSTEETGPTQTLIPTEVAVNRETCSQAIVAAITEVDTLCAATGRNQVCYGNTQLTASPEQPNFVQPGDLANIANIERLQLELDRQTQSWGVALMRLQANLPETLPGQNVTVLLFGDVQFQVGARETDVQAFYMQTGLGDAPCLEAPESGVLVQTPLGARNVVFQLNSVDITLGSTAYFQAVPSRELVASVIEGEARLTSQGISKTVPAGLRSTVPLDDAGAAAGPPGEPELYNPAELIRLPVANLARDVEIASPLFLTTFGAGAEDWGLADGEAVELAHFTDDLNGNGILCGTEQDGDDSIWYFAAPPIWLEDLEDAYGGNLIYGQNQGVVDNQLDQSEKVLLIASDGTAIAYNAGENPAADYTVYTVPLNEGAGWLHPGTNIRVTEREFRKILADLGALRILGEHRRGENTSCLDFVLVNQAVQAELSDAPSEPIRASGFEEDAEGWSTNEGGSTPIEYVEAGYVCGTDQDFLDAWYFIAPDLWLGDQSAAYGGYLLFELNQSATDGIQNNVPYNVALIGSGMSLQYRAVGNPSTEFTRYIVPLIEFEGWLKAGREEAPTQSEMVEVLSNLQELRIIAEFRGDEDTGCLNRAELYSPGARVYQ